MECAKCRKEVPGPTKPTDWLELDGRMPTNEGYIIVSIFVCPTCAIAVFDPSNRHSLSIGEKSYSEGTLKPEPS